MANEIQLGYYETGVTLYAHLWNNVGQIWNGSAFENYATANIATYNIAMTEKGTASQYYEGTMPAAAAGWYTLTVQKRIGASVAESDPYVGEQEVAFWTGTIWLTPPSIADYTTARAAKIDNLDATVSSRSTLTQAQILSDATPFAGADIDAAISSRAVAGDAMTLTAAYNAAKTAAQAGDAMALTAGERTTLTNAILDLASTVDTYTLRQVLRLLSAANGGKSSGGASDDTIRSVNDSKDRITATIDANGHRTAVTLDLS
jgi:hypothetical protein